MTYETVAAFSQSAALLIFMGMFAAVVIYAFWPGNQKQFDETARNALDLDDEVNDGGEGA